MSRALSSTALEAVNAQEPGEVFLVLLTLDHADLAAPIRVTCDAVATVSRGDTFEPYPFNLTLPRDTGDRPARARLEIDNVDRAIVEAVRSVTGPPSVVVEIVLGSAPDTVEAGPWSFTLEGVEYDALTVSGDLAFEDVLNSAYPADRFTPAGFPGLF